MTGIHYAALQRDLRGALVRYALVQGLAAPFVFLWAVGAGLFLIVWWLPALALGWTAVAAVFGAAMVVGSLRSSDAVARALGFVVERRLPARPISSRRLQTDVQRSQTLFVQVALRVSTIESGQGEDPNLRALVCAAYEMVALLVEAAKVAERAGGAECPLATPVLRELTATSRALELLEAQKGNLERGFTLGLARQAVEVLARMQDGVYVRESVGPGGPAADSWNIDDLRPEPSYEAIPAELRDGFARLRSGFSRLKLEPGQKALRQLADQYSRLLPVLERKKETDPLALAQVPQLAEETLRQGLSVLSDALDLAQAIYSPERERMEREVATLEADIASLRDNEREAARREMKEETLASHLERLEIMKGHELHVEELLHQSGRCEASLDRTRMEIAALKADGSSASVSAVTQALRKTIDQARSVQEEMKRLGL